MDFGLISEISAVKRLPWEQVFRDRARLRKWYGGARWRKVKGVAQVRIPITGRRGYAWAEIHWYEAHGIGKKEFKLKLPLFWISYEKEESAHFVVCPG